MTRAQALALTIEHANEQVEAQLEAAELDLLDQGATPEQVEAELTALRLLFEEHRDREVAAAARWLAIGAGRLH